MKNGQYTFKWSEPDGQPFNVTVKTFHNLSIILLDRKYFGFMLYPASENEVARHLDRCAFIATIEHFEGFDGLIDQKLVVSHDTLNWGLNFVVVLVHEDKTKKLLIFENSTVPSLLEIYPNVHPDEYDEIVNTILLTYLD